MKFGIRVLYDKGYMERKIVQLSGRKETNILALSATVANLVS
jgi:hypothetical protein